MLASAVIGVERWTSLLIAFRDKCLLCVDLATYDDAHLVVQLRGEQLGLSMAPDAPVLQEARLAHVLGLRAPMNAAPHVGASRLFVFDSRFFCRRQMLTRSIEFVDPK